MADGIPSQLKRFNERLDKFRREIDEELIPAIRVAAEKAEAALATASKALAISQARVSKKPDKP